jgi:hypothetical protein
MAKWILAFMLMAFLVSGCKSDKRLHLAADSPYVDPRSGTLRQDPFRPQTSWWDVLFSNDERERVKL